MKINREERVQTGAFFALLLAGGVLVVAVLSVWAKAVFSGGVWWFLFMGSGVGAIAVGEKIKEAMESLVEKSRRGRRRGKGGPVDSSRD